MNEYPGDDIIPEVYVARHEAPDPSRIETPDPIGDNDYIYWARVSILQQYNNSKMGIDEYTKRLKTVDDWSKDKLS